MILYIFLLLVVFSIIFFIFKIEILNEKSNKNNVGLVDENTILPTPDRIIYMIIFIIQFVRYIYDKYGYPLSKHINTAFQADITYILMKPLEWIFLLVLYIFDVKPENRIATQYIGKKLD